MKIPIPDPPLTDGVVTLRPWRAEDASVLAAAWADPEIARWCAVPADTSAAAAVQWIAGAEGCRSAGTALDLAVEEGGRVAGEVGLGPIQWGHHRAAIGYWVLPGARRRGLATRAVDVLCRWALDHTELELLAAETDGDNPGSQGVLSAAGFTLAAEHEGRQAWIRPA